MKQSIKLEKKYIETLKERAKELNCLYQIDEILKNDSLTIEDIINSIIEILPTAMQYSDFCRVRILYDNRVFESMDFKESEWMIKSEIVIKRKTIGSIEVYYIKSFPDVYEGPFFFEERKLLNAVADRLGSFIFKVKYDDIEEKLIKDTELSHKFKYEWEVILQMLHNTDPNLISIISKKMINVLFFRGCNEATDLFVRFVNIQNPFDSVLYQQNKPSKKTILENSYNLAIDILTFAKKYLENNEILELIHNWIYEDRASELLRVLGNPNKPLAEISEAMRKFYTINPEFQFDSPILIGIKVSLIRRLLSDHLQYLNIAKNYLGLSDLYQIIEKMIFSSESHGKIGGKSAGIILAENIIQKTSEHKEIFSNVRIPKTWFISSDGMTNFIYYNNMEDILDQKYKDLDQVRNEYPYIIQLFKNAIFPPEIINGLSRALDDFGNNPIIVRSSSLLEDRLGSAFAGKYKSLFLANQGLKQRRLEALMDAIAEVYASTIGPDPIGYRYERGLIDFNEEMGIILQEVVGKKIGNYFFPAIAGVAFSNNEFRWSPRIKREDGLIRIVAGLGTRAVDRVGNDYPTLIPAGQPDLKVNQTYEDIITYSQKYIDVINLESNSFETIPITKVLEEVGNQFPFLNEIFSIDDGQNIRKPIALGIDAKKHRLVVTFENLITNTNYIKQIHLILRDLQFTLKIPIDLEFASDGEDLYILQCRPQSYLEGSISTSIPQNIPEENIIFTANKFISGGTVPDCTHIVYIEPNEYLKIEEYAKLKEVGRLVGKLNQILPSKRFILMGPGRWGSRDDVRLGVNVAYSDINNTSTLIEIARKRGNYIPDLSFGTHFFQDLVESQIRYIPLYPDENNNMFNEEFLLNSTNILTDLLTDAHDFSNIIRVIDITKETNGKIAKILMNSDEEKAIAFISEQTNSPIDIERGFKTDNILFNDLPNWRRNLVEEMVKNLDRQKFGVKKIYVLTSSISATARHYSDIDIVINFDGTPIQKESLQLWFSAWNSCLSEINFLRSGHKINNFLDIKFITDFDYEHNTTIIRQLNSLKESYILY